MVNENDFTLSIPVEQEDDKLVLTKNNFRLNDEQPIKKFSFFKKHFKCKESLTAGWRQIRWRETGHLFFPENNNTVSVCTRFIIAYSPYICSFSKVLLVNHNPNTSKTRI